MILRILISWRILILYLLKECPSSYKGHHSNLWVKIILKEARAFFVKCAKYLQTSMPVLKNYVIKSLTFLPLPEIHQSTLEELHVLIKVLQPTRMLLNQNFLSSKQLQAMNFQLTLMRMITPNVLITFGTKCLNKLINTLVKLV